MRAFHATRENLQNQNTSINEWSRAFLSISRGFRGKFRQSWPHNLPKWSTWRSSAGNWFNKLFQHPAIWIGQPLGKGSFMNGICVHDLAWKLQKWNAGRVFGANNIEDLKRTFPICLLSVGWCVLLARLWKYTKMRQQNQKVDWYARGLD